MRTETFYLSSKNGDTFFIYKWTPDEGAAKAVVQIAHGMAEHAERYRDLAIALTEAGYAVYANDHRGHGKTAGEPEEMGFFGYENGWRNVVNDMHTLTRTIKEENPAVPVFLMGHSMGSFLSRDYASRFHADINGLILSGTADDPGIIGTLGIILAKLVCRINGKKSPSPFLETLTTGNLNRAFKPNRTASDWLSRDTDHVDKFIADPLCGGVSKSGFYVELLTGLKKINKPDAFNKVPQELPILIFSGDQDPVGGNGRGVRKVHSRYEKAGIRDLVLKLYKDGRHEMIGEINKTEVNRDITTWLDNHAA